MMETNSVLPNEMIPPSRPPGEGLFRSPLFVFFVLACLGLLIYSNTFQSSFHFDDVTSIVKNPAIRDLGNIRAIWDFWPTRFVTYLTIAVNYAKNQEQVFAYHVFNLAVHLGSSLLVWWFVLLTLSTPAFKDSPIVSHARLMSFFVALIFVAHPLQTQSVTYIIQRTTSLAAMFYLASLCLYARSRLFEERDRGRRRLCYAGSLMAAVAAMFTKEMTITLPVMILFYEFCFLKGRKGVNGKSLIPFFATLVLIPATMFLTGSVDFLQMRRVAEGSILISPGQYLLTQFHVLVTYLRLFVLPFGQNFDYDYPVAESLMQPSVLASLAVLILLVFLAVRLFRKYRIMSFAIFFFFLALSPESSTIPIRDVIFEHRLYLPMVGFGLFLVTGLYYLLRGRYVNAMVGILLILVLFYGVLTYRRNFVWKDNFTLWEDVIAKSPRKARSYNDRGIAYVLRGDYKAALADYSRAVEVSLDRRAAGEPNLGPGRKPEPLKPILFDRALAAAYFNRGFLYIKMADFDQAIADFGKLIANNPQQPSVHYYRALAHAKKGDYDKAIADLSAEIQMDPEAGEAYMQRGMLHRQRSDLRAALADFNKVIALNPRYATAYNNRGAVYFEAGDFRGALADYSKAIEINPSLAVAYANRARLYFQIGEYQKSREDLSQAEKLGHKFNPVDRLQQPRRLLRAEREGRGGG